MFIFRISLWQKKLIDCTICNLIKFLTLEIFVIMKMFFLTLSYLLQIRLLIHYFLCMRIWCSLRTHPLLILHLWTKQSEAEPQSSYEKSKWLSAWVSLSFILLVYSIISMWSFFSIICYCWYVNWNDNSPLVPRVRKLPSNYKDYTSLPSHLTTSHVVAQSSCLYPMHD